MKPPGTWGPKEFAQFTEDELHETMMGAQPGSNYFEWAKAELEHRDRRRAIGANAVSPLERQLSAARDAEERRAKKSGARCEVLSAPETLRSPVLGDGRMKHYFDVRNTRSATAASTSPSRTSVLTTSGNAWAMEPSSKEM